MRLTVGTVKTLIAHIEWAERWSRLAVLAANSRAADAGIVRERLLSARRSIDNALRAIPGGDDDG